MPTNNDFPVLQNDRILRAARGEKPDKLPVWLMRQAGRYLPEFRKLREQHSFFEICQTPSLACEVTLQPIKRYDLDAAIIFSDILVIPQALGMVVEMKPGVGPVLPDPLTLENVSDLKKEGAVERLKYVGEAITLTRHKLEGKVPLFGFSGAPVLFAKGGHFCIEEQASLGYDVLGIDWTLDPKVVRSILKDKNITVQGNLDPCALYAPKEKLIQIVNKMVADFKTDRYIVNLGHGIYPDAPVEAVETFIQTIHSIEI